MTGDRLDLSPCDADDPETCGCHFRLPELIAEVQRLRVLVGEASAREILGLPDD